MNEEDQILLAWLRGSRSTASDKEEGSPTPARVPGDDVEEFLRGMGYNRPQREQLRRGQPRPRNDAKYRAITIKRYEHYLRLQLPQEAVDNIAQLAAAWAGLTNYNLELAQRWWDAGVKPDNPGDLAKAIEGGLQIQNLGEVVHGRTIAQHLQAGNSLDWCLIALDWTRQAALSLNWWTQCRTSPSSQPGAGAHRGHITARSTAKQSEPPGSQLQVTRHVGYIRAGQSCLCTRPGLQFDSLHARHRSSMKRWQ